MLNFLDLFEKFTEKGRDEEFFWLVIIPAMRHFYKVNFNKTIDYSLIAQDEWKYLNTWIDHQKHI